jgi:hypothetical protein
MTHLLRSWKESLSLFIPKNAQLFALVTLKNILQSYTIILRDGWWLFGLSMIAEYIYTRYFGPQSFFGFIPLILWFITIFLMYLIIRPSLKRKGYSYYKDYIGAFFYFALFSILGYLFFLTLLRFALLFSVTIANPFYFVSNVFMILTALLAPGPQLMPLYVSPLLTFLILFILDSDRSIASIFKSIIRAFKMVIYNYPFCLIIFSIWALLSVCSQLLIFKIFGPHSFLLSSAVSYLLLPIPICIFTLFYTKRLHEQFGLYYPQTIKE